MENENQSKNRTHGLHLHSFLKPLLFTLVLLFVMSSGALGYILGKNASSSGELIDTIVLSPGNEVSQGNINHYFTGRVIYPDGTPCASASVELDNDSGDETDEQGKFFFVGLQSGEYHLSVTNESGLITSTARLMLDFSRGQTATADFTVPGEAELLMPENTRMLDMTLVIEGNTLTVEEGASYLVTTDGEIVDFVGGKLNVSAESLAVTPTGSVVSPEGYVLLLSRETILTPTGGNEAVSVETQPVPEVEVQDDGSAVTGGGVIIAPDNTITTPDGETTNPGENVVVVSGDTTEEIEELPQDVTEPDEESATPDGDTESDGESAVSGESTPSDEVEESAPTDSGEVPAESEAENADTQQEDPPLTAPFTTSDDGDGIALVDSDSGLEWAQMSLIDLFKNSMETETVRGVEYAVIAPGSSGSYKFKLANQNDFDIEYTIAISEETLDLPIGYSLYDSRTNYCYMSKAKPAITSSRNVPVCTKTIEIKANSEKEYLLKWNWDYTARYNAFKTNKLETEIAEAEDISDRLYTISIKVSAAQITYEEVIEGDEDTRYPGVR